MGTIKYCTWGHCGSESYLTAQQLTGPSLTDRDHTEMYGCPLQCWKLCLHVTWRRGSTCPKRKRPFLSQYCHWCDSTAYLLAWHFLCLARHAVPPWGVQPAWYTFYFYLYGPFRMYQGFPESYCIWFLLRMAGLESFSLAKCYNSGCTML